MLNRIRDIRKAKGLTLADLAAACDPPTTAQTIGRLETGHAAIVAGVDEPHCGRAGDRPRQPDAGQHGRSGARSSPNLAGAGAEALTTPRDALMPSELAAADGPARSCMEVGERGE